jgi:aminoglycoside phosphotransferase (APT) family kinase protein
MQEEIMIDDGPSVLVQGRPAQGTRHEVVFGALEGSAEPVVVKLERTPGALVREQQALEEIASIRGPAPRLVAAGTALMDGERLACLVIERRPGEAPTTDEGWRRMGRALARLSTPVTPTTQLPVLSHTEFGREHAQRVSDLGDRLAPLSLTIPDWELLVSSEVPRPSPLVLTHGDPGPGNFLDDGRDGTLIDWEEAQVAPLGLDLARLVFIALLGAGPSGFLARDHRSRARSVTDGYLTAVEGTWRPSVADARWWIAVAGIQFVHRRWQMGGQPGPWEEAAHVLRTALTEGAAWALD